MTNLQIEKFAAAPLVREPYDYVVVPGFLPPSALTDVVTNYPQIGRAHV